MKSVEKDLLSWTIKLAIQTGKLLVKYQKNLKSLKVTNKQAQGVVSIADKNAEQLIINAINNKFPMHKILAEEDYFLHHKNQKIESKKFIRDEFCWVIDPLDGTSNYLNGLDYFAVCIGLLYKGLPVLGVVFRPQTGECFYAQRGKGAFYNRNILKNSKAITAPKYRVSIPRNDKKLSDSLVVTGFSGEKGTNYEDEFKLFKKVARNVRGVRRFGSAALDLCFVGLGQFDGFWEKGLAPWDVTAAGVFCLEAGVKISGMKKSSKEFDPFAPSFVAGRPPYVERFKKVLT